MTLFEYIKQLDEKQFAIFFAYLNDMCKCEQCPFYIHCRFDQGYCDVALPKLLNEDFEVYSQESPFDYEEMKLKTER